MPSKTKKVSIHKKKSNMKNSMKSNIKRNSKTKTKPMEIEYEAKFLEVDYKELIDKLKALGAKSIHPNTLYKRSMFSLADVKRGYVRVRNEGDKTTLTAKIYKDSKFPQEYELQIKDDFENGQEFLRALNLDEKGYHETMREKWQLPYGKNAHFCEVCIDRIPGIPTYVEIECKSKKNLNKAIKMLSLDKYKKLFGSYGKCFVEYYGMTENDINNVIPKLTFGNIKNELKTYIKKNEELLAKVVKQHLDTYKDL